jgi:peroxiredoxin
MIRLENTILYIDGVCLSCRQIQVRAALSGAMRSRALPEIIHPKAKEFDMAVLDRVPQVTFKTRVRDESVPGSNPYRWQDKTTQDIFGGKKVVVFSLPGAFTPTCSSNHLPRYDELYAQFKALGVDEIVCISVNDAFVMFQWGKSVGNKNIFLLPDGNGEFTRKMGMLVDKSNVGFGMRSWRYSMLVNDCQIEKIFVEPDFGDNCPVDPFQVSDADTMMAYLKGATSAGVSKPVKAFEG